MSDTNFIEVSSPEDLKYIDSQLRGLARENKPVTIQFTMDPKRLLSLLGLIYNFWLVTSHFFFPDGTLRMPKLLEIARNFKIVKAILKIKNLFIGIWKDRDQAAEQIGENVNYSLRKPKAHRHGWTRKNSGRLSGRSSSNCPGHVPRRGI